MLKRTETLLINSALKGDQRAFQTLYRRYYLRIYRIALSRADNCDEAEDLAQVTFVRAFGALNSFRREAAFSTWLTSIALNVCHSHVQARRVEQGRMEAVEEACATLDLQGTSSFQDPEERVFQKERQDLVMRGIRALPMRYRKAMWLRYIKDRSYMEIGRELRLPMGTVKTLLCRGRRQLKGAFTKLGVGLVL